MFPSVADANVYGVAIPGTEGRAGMASIVLKGPLDLASLRSHLMKLLPPYARPLFLRVQQGLDMTATFKHQKSQLTSDGYDPSRIEDPLYFDHPARQTFVPLNAALYDDIRRGQIRV
jgi:fatty-acyl-CoA synthase